MRFHFTTPRYGQAGGGLLGLLLLPIMLLVGAVTFLAAVPVIIATYFYSRRKLKQMFREAQSRANDQDTSSRSGAKRVSSVVVETIETGETNPLLPEE